MKREQIVSFFFLALFLFIIYQLLLVFSPFLNSVFWASVLAFAFFPLHTLFQTKLRLNPTFSSILTTFIVLLIVILPAIIVISNLFRETILELYVRLNTYISSGNLSKEVFEQIQGFLSRHWNYKMGPEWDETKLNLSNALLGMAQRITKLASVEFAVISKNIFLWLLNFLFTIFFLFFFLRDGRTYYQFVYKIIPMSSQNKNHVAGLLNETFSAVIRGQFLISTLQGTLAALVLWILGFPVPVLFGCLTFFASLLPTGASTVWVPLVIYALVNGQTQRGLWLLGCGIVISTIDNVLKSILIGEKAKLPIVLLFLGLLGGVKLYGFTGLFLGPLVLTAFFALLKIYREEYLIET